MSPTKAGIDEWSIDLLTFWSPRWDDYDTVLARPQKIGHDMDLGIVVILPRTAERCTLIQQPDESEAYDTADQKDATYLLAGSRKNRRIQVGQNLLEKHRAKGLEP